MDVLRDSDGDITIDANGAASTVEGVVETVQRLRAKLQLFRGEWLLGPAEGVPYRTIVFPKTVSLAAKIQLFRELLLNDPDIASIQQLSLEPSPTTPRMWILRFVATRKGGETLRSSDFAPFTLGAK